MSIFYVENEDFTVLDALIVSDSLIIAGNSFGSSEVKVIAFDGEYEIYDSFMVYIEILGDLTSDGIINILDIVLLIEIILG